MTTANASAEYYPVLVRADLYEWMDRQARLMEQNPAPPMMEDITHCPACADDVNSLWLAESELAVAANDEALGLTPVCARCRDNDAAPPAEKSA